MRNLIGMTLAWAVLGGTSAMAAAPLCSQVLAKPVVQNISQAAFDRAVENLARLKNEADLELISGKSTTGIKGVSGQLFTLKFNEAIQQLRGQKSEAELKTAISKAITALRDPNERQREEAQKQARETQQLKEWLTPYTKADTIDLSKLSQIGDQIAYVESGNYLLIYTGAYDNRRARRVNLDTHAISDFFDASHGPIFRSQTSHNRFVLHWFKKSLTKESIHILDTKSGQAREVTIDPKILKHNELSDDFYSSPSGNYVLLRNKVLEPGQQAWGSKKEIFYLIDVNTGKARHLPELDGISIHHLSFINDHQIVINNLSPHGRDANRPHHTVERIDLNTGATEVIHEATNGISLHFDPESQTLYIFGSTAASPNTGTSSSIHIVYAQKITEEPVATYPKMTAIEESKDLRRIVMLQQSLVLAHLWNGDSQVMYLTSKGLEPINHLAFGNAAHADEFHLEDATGTPDMNRIFQLYDPLERDNYEPYIEVWKRVGVSN